MGETVLPYKTVCLNSARLDLIDEFQNDTLNTENPNNTTNPEMK